MLKPYVLYFTNRSPNKAKFNEQVIGSYDFLVSSNSTDALSIFTAHKIKVVICDEVVFNVLDVVLRTGDYQNPIKPSLIIIKEKDDISIAPYPKEYLFTWFLPPKWKPVEMQQILKLAVTFYSLAEERQDLINCIREWENKELNILKRNLLRNLSHEIRTPLCGVLGFSNLLISDIEPNARQHEYFSIIQESSDRLVNYVDNLAELMDFETCEKKVEFSQFSVREMIGNLMSINHKNAKRKMITMEFENIWEREVSLIISDRAKMYSIFGKLLGSSIYYLSKGSVKFSVKYNQKLNAIYITYKEQGFIYENNTLFKQLLVTEPEQPQSLENASVEYLILTRYVKQIQGRVWVKKKSNNELVLIARFPIKPE
jgi:K+-sensing histidine kinase KdpD